MTTQYSYQPVSTNYQDVEANKPPPYSSTYMYGNQQQATAPPQPNYGAPPDNYGAESQPFGSNDDDGISAFSDKSVRQGFIRKVYAILFVQLLVSIAIVCLFVLVKPVNAYVKKSVGMFWAAWIATIVLMIAIACCESVRRSFPMNFILLGAFTLCEGYLVGVVSAMIMRLQSTIISIMLHYFHSFTIEAQILMSKPVNIELHYHVKEVLLAMGIVAVVTLAITIFAFQTKYDFTMMGGCLFVAIIVLFCFGILTIFFHNTIVRLIYACLGALIFGLYLVFDTQLMLGGSKKYSLSPEEYIFAALNLYIDVIMLFLYILEIIGIARR